MGGRPSIWKLPVLSGVLFYLAYWTGIVIPSVTFFVPMLLWLELEPEAPAYRRLRAGFAFGLATHLLALHWMYAMLDFSWLAVLLYVGLTLLFSLKYAIAVSIVGWLRHRTRWSFGVLLPAVWIPVEWLATFGDLRMTADHVGQSMGSYVWLAQFIDVTGTYGAGAWLLALNGLVFGALYAVDRRAGVRALAAIVAVALPVLVYDGWAWGRWKQRIQDAPTMRVGVIQPDIALRVKRGTKTEQEQWRTLERLTRRAAAEGAELVVWPESARPYPLVHRRDRQETFAMLEVQRLARELGISMLIGTEYARVEPEGRSRVYNAALMAHADGTLDPSWGGKVFLVPFTEGVPFRSLIGPWIENRGGEWRWLAGGFTPAPDSALLPVRDGPQVGVLVCYEHFFPSLARGLRNRGATLQAVISNDAWFGRSVFQRYQIQSLRLRAIENRTSYARAGNTGPTGFMDPLGRFHERTPLFEEHVRVRDVPLIGSRTFYSRTGEWPVWLGFAVSIVAVVAGRRRQGSRTA